MIKNIILILTLLFIMIPLFFFTACEDNNIKPELKDTEALEELDMDAAEAENILARAKEMYAEFKIFLSDALFSTPRVVHDRNLKTIDRAVELFQLVEGKDPTGIGTPDEAGTLVGENYLDGVPKIPAGLIEAEGKWSKYTLEGNPLRTWPVGDWGGYRDGDEP